MTQRKLTDDELQKVMAARHTIRTMCCWLATDRGSEYWGGVTKQLDAMALHATADGKPYVEPEPPIPDGYRKAVAGDEGRLDCMIWRGKERGYVPRWNNKSAASHCEFQPNETYIVPADRTPTNEEASQLPIVMVRDYPDRLWEKSRLVRVSESGYSCLAASRRNLNKWAYCRHLYPGE